MLCRHCQTKKANRPRGLCWPCYYTPGVKELYPSTSKYGRRHDLTSPSGYEQKLEQEYAKSPLWKPSDLASTDPRYRELVAAREAEKLPARHPGDRAPDLS